MAPPCRAFDASELQRRVQMDLNGKKRKVEGGADTDLSKCALRAMMQFRCIVETPEISDSPVECYPIQRFFRLCQDKKGTFTVETTAWERLSAREKQGNKSSGKPPDVKVSKGKGKGKGEGDQETTYHQWSQAWESDD